MDIDELIKFIKSRRSMRRFKPDPIPDGDITKMLEAARWSPSGANGQPWEFIVVKDQKTKTRMAELYLEVRKEHYPIEQTRVERIRHNQLLKPVDEIPGFKDAPVIIVICGDRRVFQASILAGRFIGEEVGLEGTYAKSVANATYGILLAAAALGLGGQWVTIDSYYSQLLKPLLGVPPIIQLHTMLPIGYPAYETKPPYRRSLAEMTHYEKYDKSKFRSPDQVLDFIAGLRGHTKSAYAQERTK